MLGVGLLLGAGPLALIAATGAFVTSLNDAPQRPLRRVGRLLAAAAAVALASTVALAGSAHVVLYAAVIAVVAVSLGLTTLRRPVVAQMLSSSLMAAIVFAHVGAAVPAVHIGALLFIGGLTTAILAGAWEVLYRWRTAAGSIARPENDSPPSPVRRVHADTVVFATIFAALTTGLALAADLSHVTDMWWVPITFVAILRPQPSMTLRSASLQLAGAVAAALPVGLLIVAVRPPQAILVILVLLSVLGARRYLGTHDALGSFWLTLFILTALDLAGQLRPDTGIIRIAAIVIGGAVALLFAAIWARVMTTGRSGAGAEAHRLRSGEGQKGSA